MPRDNAIRVVSGARALSPNLGERMMAARLLGKAVVLRDLMPQDLRIEAEHLNDQRASSLADRHPRGGLSGALPTLRALPCGLAKIPFQVLRPRQQAPPCRRRPGFLGSPQERRAGDLRRRSGVGGALCAKSFGMADGGGCCRKRSDSVRTRRRRRRESRGVGLGGSPAWLESCRRAQAGAL